MGTQNKSSSKLTLSFAIGLALIPLSALAAVTLIGGTEPEVASATEPQAVVAVPDVSQVVFGAVGDATPEDLAVACGEAGMALVAMEESGSISPVGQAALDALRPICEGRGTPLPGKPSPDAITRTVTITQPVAAPVAATVDTSTTTVAGNDDTSEGDSQEQSSGDDPYSEEDDHSEDENSEDGHSGDND